MCGVFNESLVQYLLSRSSVRCPEETDSKKQAYIANMMRICIRTKLEKLI